MMSWFVFQTTAELEENASSVSTKQRFDSQRGSRTRTSRQNEDTLTFQSFPRRSSTEQTTSNSRVSHENNRRRTSNENNARTRSDTNLNQRNGNTDNDYQHVTRTRTRTRNRNVPDAQGYETTEYIKTIVQTPQKLAGSQFQTSFINEAKFEVTRSRNRVATDSHHEESTRVNTRERFTTEKTVQSREKSVENISRGRNRNGESQVSRTTESYTQNTGRDRARESASKGRDRVDENVPRSRDRSNNENIFKGRLQSVQGEPLTERSRTSSRSRHTNQEDKKSYNNGNPEYNSKFQRSQNLGRNQQQQVYNCLLYTSRCV